MRSGFEEGVGDAGIDFGLEVRQVRIDFERVITDYRNLLGGAIGDNVEALRVLDDLCSFARDQLVSNLANIMEGATL